jgi:signal transduction histidine kinase/ActR/RegA family two-component response regulator
MPDNPAPTSAPADGDHGARPPAATDWRRRSRPKWHIVYFALAAFDILAVSLGLALSHGTMEIYSDSVALNRQSSERLGRFIDLAQRAADVNAPGNSVFDSGDIEAEYLRMVDAQEMFRSGLEGARRDLAGSTDRALSRALSRDLEAASRAMQLMVAEAERIFAHFRAGQAAQAGARMAAMDRHYYDVNVAFGTLIRDASELQREMLLRQQREAERLRRWEWVIAAAILAMVLAITVYGHLLARKMNRDHDALIEAKDRAERAERTKSRFVANMSHEIRTPLNGVVGAAALLGNSSLDRDQRRYVDVITASTRSLAALINSVLDMAKIEAGRMELEQVAYDMRQLCEELCDSVRLEAARSGVEVWCQLSGAIPKWVLGDPVRMRQVLANLLGNAVKFTERGHVGLAATVLGQDADGLRVRVEVHDTGAGISSDALEYILEPFRQAEDNTTRLFGGTGLGLSIAREIVALMGGRLEVRSEEGRGSVFSFEVLLQTVPCAPVDETPEPLVVESADPGPLPAKADVTLLAARRRPRVLVAEDNEVGRFIAHEMLSRLGFDVTMVCNGREAWEAARDGQFVLALMDCRMPDWDGFMATAAIRRHEQETGAARLPIVAMTANNSRADRERCLEAGMDDYLAKPYLPEDIERVLARWVRRHGGGERARERA